MSNLNIKGIRIINEDITNKIYYNYISLFMKPFSDIHRELKWIKIHKQLKNSKYKYLNLTDIIFPFDMDFIFIIRIPYLILPTVEE